jgi:hypothetical protein
MPPNQAWIDFMQRWLAPPKPTLVSIQQSKTPLADKQSTRPKPIEASEAELASIVKLDAELNKNNKTYSDTRAKFSNILRAASNRPKLGVEKIRDIIDAALEANNTPIIAPNVTWNKWKN